MNKTIDELIASYDPQDFEFERRFRDYKTNKPSNMSFLPTEEELDEILIEPLRKMRLVAYGDGDKHEAE